MPFLESASLEKRKRSVIKQFYKISKKLKIGLKKIKIKIKRPTDLFSSNDLVRQVGLELVVPD